MWRNGIAVLGLASMVLLGVPAPAQAVAERSWAPSGNWSFDTNSRRCAAARSYQLGKDKLTLGFEFIPLSEGVIALIEMPGRPRRIEFETFQVDAGNGYQQRQAMLRRSAKEGLALRQVFVSRPDFQGFVTSGLFRARGPGTKIQVPVTGLKEVGARLDQCLSQLLARWGLNAQEQARMATPPALKGGPPLSGDDYPVDAIKRNAIGSVEGVVDVSVEGAASNCKIVRTSGHEDIDQATCVNMSKRIFTPASDHDGKPMRSIFYFRASWLIEN